MGRVNNLGKFCNGHISSFSAVLKTRFVVLWKLTYGVHEPRFWITGQAVGKLLPVYFHF